MREERHNDLTKDLELRISAGRQSTGGCLGYVGQEYELSVPHGCLCGIFQIGTHKFTAVPGAVSKEVPLEDMDTGQIATIEYGTRKSTTLVCFYVRRIE